MSSGVGAPWVRELVAQLEQTRKEKREAAAQARREELSLRALSDVAVEPKTAARAVRQFERRNEVEWSQFTAALLREARSSLDLELLRPDRRLDGAVVNEVRTALVRWRDRALADQSRPVEDYASLIWRPYHYWLLRLQFADVGGAAAYQYSLHWRAVSTGQRDTIRYCERCNDRYRARPLDAHHLHYESLGAERIGVDLLTLCRPCHFVREHGYDVSFV
jgi:hypothetical protein